MRQHELHLGGDVPPGVRGENGYALATGAADHVLRGGQEEAGGCRRAGSGNGGEEAMAHQPAAATIAFVIPGTPVGKGRPKFARRGNFVSTYTPEKTASYENLVRVKAEEPWPGAR